ncbi:MAG: endo-1,4-beta-xylanase, partial [Bacteroidaceae bacterium]|nr:endo-1,4-beta-xylanase [Bacteroidaceae bacterium]
MTQKKIFIAAMLLCGSTAISAQEHFEMGNPNDPNYTYLNEYAAIKDYVDRTKYPNFKVGLAVEAPDYNNKGTVYRLTNKNFHETVAGNAMKMASCVDNNGNMNFNTVKSFVNNATAAGLNVYGHTLAWHAQQPAGWLNSLIKDKPAEPIPGADTPVLVELASKDFRVSQNIPWTSDQTQFGFSFKYDTTNGMTVTTTKKTTNNWDVQYLTMTDIPTEKGKTYKAIITMKGSDDGKMNVKLGDWTSGPAREVSFTTEWQDIEVEFTNCLANSFLMFQHGHFVGTVNVKQIVIKEQVMGKKVTEDIRCIVVNATAKKSEVWENQFWLKTGSFSANSKYEFSAKVRADNNAKASTQVHNAPGTYVDWQAIGDVQFTTEWKTVKSSGTFAKAGQSIAFNLNEYSGANNYYFTDISLKINGVEKIVNGSLEGTDVSSFAQKVNSGAVVSPTISDQITYVLLPQPVPMTQEEKCEALAGAMEKWISGMMTACNGKVKAWDLVNEAISGGDADSEGVYALQHYGGDGDFFWQTHMGDLEYVRNACRLARQYGPEDVKLFINDYNLESDWDGNNKLKSLIKWIQRWEADGVT